MPEEEQHPTQSVAPDARLVDPEEAILAEFLPTTQEPHDQRPPVTDMPADNPNHRQH